MDIRINEILSRLPLPGLKESVQRHTIAEVIETHLGMRVLPKQITYKDEVVFTRLPPLMKSALQLQKVSIKNKLKELGIIVTDIH